MDNTFNTTCSDCGEACEVWEEVNTAMIGKHLEIWCYCKKCDCETFHESPSQVVKENNG